MFGFSATRGMGILVPRAGIEPVPPALEAKCKPPWKPLTC